MFSSHNPQSNRTMCFAGWPASMMVWPWVNSFLTKSFVLSTALRNATSQFTSFVLRCSCL